MYVIVGLGNPGNQYAETRHNVGFEVIDKLAFDFKIKINKLKFKALIGETLVNNEKVVLVKPQTFMNLSGESIREILQFYKISNDELIIVYDDVSLPVGKIRIRAEGSDGGHNGIKSILYLLETDKFKRIKIGVGNKPENWVLSDYVLSRFSKEEVPGVIEGITKAADAAVFLLTNDLQATMNKFN